MMRSKWYKEVLIGVLSFAFLLLLVHKGLEEFSVVEVTKAKIKQIDRNPPINVSHTDKIDDPPEYEQEVTGRDLQVKYLSDVETLHRLEYLTYENASHFRRVIGHMMEPMRFRDDYRFCVKEAPMEGPFNFTGKSMNPCWFDERHELQCIPYFYLAGVSKSGTTDLYSRITKHPNVFSDSWKEKHWLDFSRYFIEKDSVSYYSKTFATFRDMVAERIRQQGYNDLVVGDGTPCYFFFSLYWPCYEGNRGLTQPKYTNADVIYTMNPHSKIILSMRDPVRRLFSRYMTLLKNNASSPLYFHQSTSRAVDMYTACIRDWSPRHCAYNGTLYKIVKTRLQEGMYSIYLRDWLDVFPKDQILMFKFEDYVKDVPSHMKAIFDFLELPPISNASLHTIANSKGRQNSLPPGKGEMMQETIDMLQKFYRPYNKDLQELLEDSSWSWGYDE